MCRPRDNTKCPLTLTVEKRWGKVPDSIKGAYGFESREQGSRLPEHWVNGIGRNVSSLFLTSLAMLLVNSLVGAPVARLSTAADRLPAQQSDPPAAAQKPSRSIDSQAASSPAVERGDIEPPVAARHWQSIVVHHSATGGGDVASIDAVHRTQKDRAGKAWRGIGYHFVVGNGQAMADGEIAPTFRWRQQLDGAHTSAGDYNERGIGICLIGNFDEQPPTRLQVIAARRLVAALATRFEIDRTAVVRHSDVQATRCPGRLLPWDQIKPEIPPSKGP